MKRTAKQQITITESLRIMNSYQIIYSVIIDQTEICDETIVTAVNFGFAVMQVINLVKLNFNLPCVINWIQKI